MSPESPNVDRPRFESALRLALTSQYADAVRSVVGAVAGPEAERAHGDEAAAALVEVSRLAIEAGDHPAADEALVAAILIRPHQPDLLHERARARLGAGDLTEARALLTRALELDPGHAASRLDLALLDAREGRLGEALGRLRRLSREVSGDEREAFGRGVERLERADLESAERLLREAVEGGERGRSAAVAAVRADLRDGRLERAAAAVDQLLDRHPDDAELHALRGAVESRRRWYDDAVVSLGRSLELRPDDHDARVEFACALEGLGMRVQALEQIQIVLEREPGHARASELDARWSAPGRRPSPREIRESKHS
jgi:tetratricopeptide (TPR) repeat protein